MAVKMIFIFTYVSLFSKVVYYAHLAGAGTFACHWHLLVLYDSINKRFAKRAFGGGSEPSSLVQ